MATVAKISPIKKEFSSNLQTIDSSLARHGYVRAPGTGRMFLPYKERTGVYRTGLDVNAPYLKRLKELSEEEYNAEVKRITETKLRLEKALNCQNCLDANSDFYNVASNAEPKVYPVKLSNEDKIFDLRDTMEEITWHWMKTYPLIASSLQAYMRGECPPECQYYVADEEAETKIAYSKKKEINHAIAAFEKMEPSVKKQTARLLGLPVSDETPEEEVYNIVDNALKEVEFKSGRYKGMSTVRMFTEIANLSAQRRKVKDLVEQVLAKNIYREKGSGRIYEGEIERFKSKADLVEFLLDDGNQEDLLVLEKRLTTKKLAEY